MILRALRRLRRVLGSPPATPIDPPKPTAAVASSPREHLASLVPGQDISAVLATLPDAPKPRRGRPYTYHQDQAASPAERKRREYWRAKGNARREPHENHFRDAHENPPLKEEEKKNGRVRQF